MTGLVGIRNLLLCVDADLLLGGNEVPSLAKTPNPENAPKSRALL